jgi:hypothetical protein
VLGDERQTIQIKSAGLSPTLAIQPDIKAEHPNSTHKNMPDPEAYSAHVIIVSVHIKQVELARVERRASTEEEQMVHKIPELLR